MKKLIPAALAAAAAGAILVAAPAHADGNALIAWANANGFEATDSAILNRGQLVCADIALGDNGMQAAHDLWLNTGIDSPNDAVTFVLHAVSELCPQYLPGGTSNPTGFGNYQT